MKKRQKKYNPNKIKVNCNAGLNVIQNLKPLTKKSKVNLWKQAFVAISAMQFGKDVTRQDFTVLCDMLNISLLLTEKGLGKECLTDLYEARDGLQRAKERFINNGKLGFDKPALDAVTKALDIHEAQLEICTFGEFSGAYDEQNIRISAGNFYKPDINEKVGASS